MLNHFGGQSFAPHFSNPSPKNGPFLLIFSPKGPQKRSHISAQRTFFQKSPLTIVVLHWMMRFLERKCTSCQKSWCPIDFASKLGKNGFFCFFSWGTATIEMRFIFIPGNQSFNAELQTYVSFFEKKSIGPRYGGLIWRLRGNRDQKLGGGISKRGLKTAPQNFLTTLFDSKINVDHDFTIKRDLTQWFDQIRVVRSWMCKNGKKAWLYLTFWVWSEHQKFLGSKL